MSSSAVYWWPLLQQRIAQREAPSLCSCPLCTIRLCVCACAQSNLPQNCRYGHEIWHSILTVLSAVLMDFLLVGCAIATAGWCALSNGVRCIAEVVYRLGS